LAWAYRQLAASNGFDPDKVILAGFSQGGALAIYVALTQEPFRPAGFIVVAPSPWDVDLLGELIQKAGNGTLRGTIVTGAEDHGLSAIQRVHQAMTQAGISCRLVIEPGSATTSPGTSARSSRIRFAIFSEISLTGGVNEGNGARAPRPSRPRSGRRAARD
jgi:predicted esterase